VKVGGFIGLGTLLYSWENELLRGIKIYSAYKLINNFIKRNQARPCYFELRINKRKHEHIEIIIFLGFPTILIDFKLLITAKSSYLPIILNIYAKTYFISYHYLKFIQSIIKFIT
jgi:hypothetical protein